MFEHDILSTLAAVDPGDQDADNGDDLARLAWLAVAS